MNKKKRKKLIYLIVRLEKKMIREKLLEKNCKNLPHASQ